MPVPLSLPGMWRSGPSRLYLNSLWQFRASVRQVQFGTCSSANPVVLLRLFPSLAPEELLSPVLHLFPWCAAPACSVISSCDQSTIDSMCSCIRMRFCLPSPT